MNTSASMRHAHARRAICAALAALWAGHAAAQADPTTTPRAPRQRAPAARNVTAAPSATLSAPVAASRAVPLPPPPAGTHQISSSVTAFGHPVHWEAMLGPAFGFSRPNGLLLRTEAIIDLPPLARDVAFQGVAALGFDFGGESQFSATLPVYSYYFPAGFSAGTISQSDIATELTAGGRFIFPVMPKVTLACDAALGLGETFSRVTTDVIFMGKTTDHVSATSAVLRLGAAIRYDLNDRVRLIAQPIGLSLHVGSDSSVFTLVLGASYRL